MRAPGQYATHCAAEVEWYRIAIGMKMTPEEQRVAIAQWCGWTTRESKLAGGFVGMPPGSTSKEDIRRVPDFPNDLNAMHEAEAKLSNDDADDKFYHWLGFVVSEGQTEQLWQYRKAIVHATAVQRAEALLRTIGEWVEK